MERKSWPSRVGGICKESRTPLKAMIRLLPLSFLPHDRGRYRLSEMSKARDGFLAAAVFRIAASPGIRRDRAIWDLPRVPAGWRARPPDFL